MNRQAEVAAGGADPAELAGVDAEVVLPLQADLQGGSCRGLFGINHHRPLQKLRNQRWSLDGAESIENEAPV